MKRELKLGISIVFSIAIMALIISAIDVNKTVGILLKTKIEYVLIAAIIYFILNWGMAKRIEIILREFGEKIDIKNTLKANFGGMIASDFTPARSGYFLTAFIISRENGIDLHKTMASIFAPQLIEFAIKIICSAIVGLIIINNSNLNLGNYPILLFAGLLISAGTIGFFALLLLREGLLERFSFMKKMPVVSKAYYLFFLMRENLPAISKKWREILGLTIFVWVMKGLEWFFLARALNIVIFDPILDFGFYIFFHSFLTFTNFIPVPSIAGAGATEATSALVFVLLGSNAELGVTFAVLARVVMIIVDMIGLSAIIPLFAKEKLEGILEDIENIEKSIKN